MRRLTAHAEFAGRRYIGKGSNGRMHFHVIEARRINSRRARGANTDRTATKFYRKLAEAMPNGSPQVL
jgi:hypothetical protein